jgi:hypothetical protein
MLDAAKSSAVIVSLIEFPRLACIEGFWAGPPRALDQHAHPTTMRITGHQVMSSRPMCGIHPRFESENTNPMTISIMGPTIDRDRTPPPWSFTHRWCGESKIRGIFFVVIPAQAGIQ